jgi:hypothetical protein
MTDTAFVTAFLEDVRAQAQQGMVPADDALRLLAIAQGVLDLADGWEDKATTQYAAVRQCADELRRRVERELLGEGESDA